MHFKRLRRLEEGGSIVDYMKAAGLDSSKQARKEFAKVYNIANYTGTKDQNIKMLNALRNSINNTKVSSVQNDEIVNPETGEVEYAATRQYDPIATERQKNRINATYEKLQSSNIPNRRQQNNQSISTPTKKVVTPQPTQKVEQTEAPYRSGYRDMQEKMTNNNTATDSSKTMENKPAQSNLDYIYANSRKDINVPKQQDKTYNWYERNVRNPLDLKGVNMDAMEFGLKGAAAVTGGNKIVQVAKLATRMPAMLRLVKNSVEKSKKISDKLVEAARPKQQSEAFKTVTEKIKEGAGNVINQREGMSPALRRIADNLDKNEIPFVPQPIANMRTNQSLLRNEEKLAEQGLRNMMRGTRKNASDKNIERNLNDLYERSFYQKGGIYIKPENRGKFNATKARTGKTTEELTHSKNPVTKKRAIFAQNASKWRKEEEGGMIESDQYKSPYMEMMRKGGMKNC